MKEESAEKFCYNCRKRFTYTKWDIRVRKNYGRCLVCPNCGQHLFTYHKFK